MPIMEMTGQPAQHNPAPWIGCCCCCCFQCITADAVLALPAEAPPPLPRSGTVIIKYIFRPLMHGTFCAGHQTRVMRCSNQASTMESQ